ncbi:hypothetical protein, partial [Streptomyces sp. XY006]|uniref:hypothetical protein n=1 Tax=Streptomyces sp. XY006 TaxID=2021410 RepID=UPI0015C69277
MKHSATAVLGIDQTGAAQRVGHRTVRRRGSLTRPAALAPATAALAPATAALAAAATALTAAALPLLRRSPAP